MPTVETLRNYQLFQGLSEAQLANLAPCLSKRTFARGAYLFYPGSPNLNIYLVESGLIRMFFTNAIGQEFLLDLLGPRSILGISILRENQNRVIGAAALQLSTLLILSQKDLDQFIERYPHFMQNIYQAVDDDIRRLLFYARGMATISVTGRIASALLYITQRLASGTQNELELPVGQADLATWVGASRGALNRALSRLQQLGLLRVEGQKFTILDRPGLQRMTEDLLLDQE